jgi:hypothetical protein
MTMEQISAVHNCLFIGIGVGIGVVGIGVVYGHWTFTSVLKLLLFISD